jgi:hypothetical protein
VLLAIGQVRYQLMLLMRSPLGFFLSIVFPLLLLIFLNVVTPARPVDGLPYAQWLTPAMCAFCLLNACYMTAITSMMLAREEGILKRLRGTPLPGLGLPGRAVRLRLRDLGDRVRRDHRHRGGVLPREHRLARVRLLRRRHLPGYRLFLPARRGGHHGRPEERERAADRVRHDAAAGVHLRCILLRQPPARVAARAGVSPPRRPVAQAVEGCFNPVRRRFERHLPVLDPRVELVIYRVAQESLTNVARHAQVTEVLVSLKRGDSVVLRVLTMAGDSMPDLPRAAACAASVSALIVGSRLR